MSSRKKRPAVDVNLSELDNIVDAAQERALSEKEHTTLKTALHAMAEYLMPSLNTEKLARLLEAHRPPREPKDEAAPVRGHGRNGASAFTGAKKVPVPHPTLEAGCRCPGCEKGKVYPLHGGPSPRIRITAEMPFQATVYELDQLRCNACGEVFRAEEPEDIGPDKYDETVPSMIAELKYGSGVPFNRIEGLQAQAGVPLPASTQWDLVQEAAELVKPVHEELVEQAAQADVVHSDDTKARILDVERAPDDERTGLFTTGIVAQLADEHKVALFFSGTQHAGENVTDLLAQRASEREVILMCDGLKHNVPKVSEGVELLVANCLAHGRRHIVDVVGSFPDQCLHVLELLGQVYGHDQKARELGLDPKERLRYHQTHSKPVMSQLHSWMEAELADKRVEPNSGLGKALKYLMTHWKSLTLFLRQSGAPLDNNICERAIKKAVLHRKNALFFRTMTGAGVADIFMTLIHTCELNGVNSFEYLNVLQRNAAEIRRRPAAWMPWNYQDALLRAP